MGAGDWRLGARGSRIGTGDGELGKRESESRQPIADAGTSCPLSAYRLPNLLIVFSKR